MLNMASVAANVMSSPLAMAAGDTVNFRESWSKFWSSLTSSTGIGGLFTLLSLVGMLLVAMAIIKWAWDRRRGGGGGGSGAIIGAVIVGALLSAPNLIIPIVLLIVDVVINAVAKIVTNAARG